MKRPGNEDKPRVPSAMYRGGVGIPIISRKPALSTMDIDEALERIGEFGPSQKRIFFLVNLCQVYAALTAFALSFAGNDPGWKCKTTSKEEVITDPDLRCLRYEQGECEPVYSKEFTSIVTEVCTCTCGWIVYYMY